MDCFVSCNLFTTASAFIHQQLIPIISYKQKKVVLVAFAIFGMLASCVLTYRYCFWTRGQPFWGNAPLEPIKHLVQPESPFPNPIHIQLVMADPDDIHIKQAISPVAAKMTHLCPELVLGSHHLFQWDPANELILLSPPFRSLLKLLAELGTLESTKIDSLNDLNALLQKPQGEGGLLRKPTSERWNISDHPLWLQKRADLHSLLNQLGFVHPQSVSFPLSIKHCIIFGARVERIEARMQETIRLLLKGDLKAENIFLLGSKRKLIPEERLLLENKIKVLVNEEQKAYWHTVFAEEEQATEANACVFLWECLSPPHLQKELVGKVIPIQSTQIGFSYRENEGHRTTCEVTAADWLSYYADDERQTIFAFAEQPFLRLGDQLRSSVLTNAKQASVDLMNHRIANTIFYFANPQPREEPLVGVVLDEIARNVYRTVDLLRYLEKL